MDPLSANLFYLVMSPAFVFVIIRSNLSGFYIAHLIRDNLPEVVFNGYRVIKASAFSYIVATLMASVFAVSSIDAALVNFGLFLGYNILVLGVLSAMASDPVGIWYGYNMMANTVMSGANSPFE